MPRKTTRPSSATGSHSRACDHLFRITLRDVRPPVWRRIRVGDVSLDAFHSVIQAAMGWHDRHRHFFQSDSAWYGRPGCLDDQPFAGVLGDSSAVTVGDLLRAADGPLRLAYVYDMGDRWEHEIVFEGTSDGVTAAPACLAGARACPPEDCGGVGGFEYLLEVLGDPDHSEHLDLVESLGRYDPDAFDPAWATARMTRLLKAS